MLRKKERKKEKKKRKQEKTNQTNKELRTKGLMVKSLLRKKERKKERKNTPKSNIIVVEFKWIPTKLKAF